MITVALSITVFLMALILISVARYTFFLKQKLKDIKEENTSIKNRNYALIDQLNGIESKIQEATVNYGDRIVPLILGSYRIEAACNSVIIGCEAGCKSLSGGEVKHHKDCKYYPDSLSKYYDELELQLRNAVAYFNSTDKEELQWGDRERMAYYEGFYKVDLATEGTGTSLDMLGSIFALQNPFSGEDQARIKDKFGQISSYELMKRLYNWPEKHQTRDCIFSVEDSIDTTTWEEYQEIQNRMDELDKEEKENNYTLTPNQ